MMGGGTPKVEAKIAPPVAMSDVLVASTNLQPGQSLTADQVRWEKWPSSVGRFHLHHARSPPPASTMR